jgi:hypothetical protein
VMAHLYGPTVGVLLWTVPCMHESIKKWALLAAVWDLDFLRPAVK